MPSCSYSSLVTNSDAATGSEARIEPPCQAKAHACGELTTRTCRSLLPVDVQRYVHLLQLSQGRTYTLADGQELLLKSEMAEIPEILFATDLTVPARACRSC